MEASNKKNKEQEATAEAVAELARLLGLSEERTRELLGSRVRGTAEFGRTGDFHFSPSRETGPRLERIKTTRGGSSLTRTLAEQPRMKMTLYSSPGSADPEADIVDEANRLMKNFRQPRELPRRGRLLYDADGIRIRADTAAGTLTVSMAMPLTQGTDYSATLLNSISTVLKTLAQNKDNITRLEKNHDKLPKNTDIKG